MFPKPVTRDVLEKIEQCRQKLRTFIPELSSQSPVREVYEEINDRWHALLLSQLNAVDDSLRVYKACYEMMMLAYKSYELAGTAGIAATPERFWVDRITERAWIPLIMELAEITQEQRAEFERDYAASVI